MNKYIFHGGGSAKNVTSNNTFFHELVKDAPENGIVLLVYFASREDDYSDRIAYDTEKYKAATNKKLTVMIAHKDDFIKQALEADVIYLRGGSTEKLITTPKEYPELEKVLVNKPKTIAGSSAGAYALSTYFSSHYEDIAASGLGIVPVRVITHYESEKMSPRAGAIEALRNTARELPLITLRETEWEVFLST